MFYSPINCNNAFDACNRAKVKTIGIGAVDIQEGNTKLILALMWQLVRMHYM